MKVLLVLNVKKAKKVLFAKSLLHRFQRLVRLLKEAIIESSKWLKPCYLADLLRILS